MWSGLLQKVFKVREKVAMNLSGKGDEEKPFLDHLEDLRKMIVRIVTTLLVSTIGTFYFYDKLFEIIKLPLWWTGVVKTEADVKGMLQILTPQEGFMMVMNLALIAAVIFAFPVLLYFVLQFILPGLKPAEKKAIFPAIGIGAALFLIGASFAFYIVLPKALEFFYSFNSSLGLVNGWRLADYVKFATRFILLFGVAFELPVIVMVLVKLDFLNYKLMSTTRSYAIIAIAIFAAVVTPTPDPFTMLVLAAPLYVLYETCIWLAYFMEKKDRAAFPEYYADIDKDEKALEQPGPDDWDNENYNPWSSGDDDADDKDDYQTPDAKPSAPPPDVENSDIEDHGEDQSSQMPDEDPADQPPREMTLEELAREDEKRSSEPPKDS
ncbi:twin-arginine translocase subunit TatC [Prosthecobacter sp.]|uniref:twin-arginine translocase subunit TatC n=1 Tax=Prosthecobacter sp. TaxID=1965333 RepID=UPI002488BC77|nr:twin-arginine translocase subunit TatC [Prosthecobacter sp.]MDI1313878.1 twin-arginine translocase subunit TatC [Prosthecobacter sp.]